jgi:integrase
MAKMHKLTAAQIRDARPGDRLSDGGGLRLDIDRAGNSSWIFRFTSPTTGKERYLGLGPLADVTLPKARIAAAKARDLLRNGKDPLDEKREARATARLAAVRGITFRQCAERLMDAHAGSWKNPIHRKQWRSTLQMYAYPVIGDVSVQDVDTGLVMQVLEPIWNKIPETASRVRGRIEAVLDWATVAGYRQGDNPAVWRGRLVHLLPSKRKVRPVQHHAALPYAEMPAFFSALSADKSDAARLLRFIVLTAARYSEAAKMEPAEIAGDVWRIPASRMKAARMHEVPLTAAALACLDGGIPRASDVSLANVIARHTDKPATTHGMRSTFRDWAGDETHFPREVVEAALAHTLGKVEGAYRRGTALAKRRELMAAWADFCLGLG